jgi:hypothetical protein
MELLMTAPLVTVGGKEVQVVGGSTRPSRPAPAGIPADPTSEDMNESDATAIAVFALLASLLILITAILVKNRLRTD